MDEITGTYDVVVIGPHPDDVEMGMAGTVIRLVETGKSVLNICLTRGEKGTYGTTEIRRREFAAANKVLGSTPYMSDFPDTAVTVDQEGKLKIARMIREARPKIVFAPYHTNPHGHHDGAANVDHFATGLLVRDGVKLARFKSVMPEIPAHDVPYLYYYMVPKSKMPNIVVDVTSVIDRARDSILAYETQMAIQKQKNPILHTLDVLRSYYGLFIGVEYGEAFYSEEAISFGPTNFFGPSD